MSNLCVASPVCSVLQRFASPVCIVAALFSCSVEQCVSKLDLGLTTGNHLITCLIKSSSTTAPKQCPPETSYTEFDIHMPNQIILHGHTQTVSPRYHVYRACHSHAKSNHRPQPHPNSVPHIPFIQNLSFTFLTNSPFATTYKQCLPVTIYTEFVMHIPNQTIIHHHIQTVSPKYHLYRACHSHS